MSPGPPCTKQAMQAATEAMNVTFEVRPSPSTMPPTPPLSASIRKEATASAVEDTSSEEARVAAIAAAVIVAQAREAAKHQITAPSLVMSTTNGYVESGDQPVAKPTDSGLATPELQYQQPAQQPTHVKTATTGWTAAPPAPPDASLDADVSPPLLLRHPVPVFDTQATGLCRSAYRRRSQPGPLHREALGS